MKIRIVGMGALGLLFGSLLSEHYGSASVRFLMNHDRYLTHSKDVYRINGKEVHFALEDADSLTEEECPADFILVSVKYSGLEGALREMKNLVGPGTVIVSLMNGISSEQIIGERFGREKVVDSVAIGMDAVRTGTDLIYSHMGVIRIGISQGETKESLDRAVSILSGAGIPVEVQDDVLHTMWSKFQLNVGINQTCMVYDCGYGKAVEEGSEQYEKLVGAMREVIKIAEAEQISLTEADTQSNLKVIQSASRAFRPVFPRLLV